MNNTQFVVPLLSTSKVWSKSIAKPIDLPLDHMGRRVILDTEGSGILTVKADARILIDESNAVEVHHSSEHSFKFKRSLSVYAGSDFPVALSLHRDVPNLPDSNFETNNFEGCGWFFPLSSQTHCDHSHQSSEPNWYPFFLRVEGLAKILPASNVRAEPILDFSVSDLGLQQVQWKVKNCSEILELTSSFADGIVHNGAVLSHLNTATFVVQVANDNLGIRFRKLYDQFHGRQRARILVNGVNSGWWYESNEDRKHRWAWADYGVPPELTAGQSQVEISIDPPPASPLWSVGRYQVLQLRPL